MANRKRKYNLPENVYYDRASSMYVGRPTFHVEMRNKELDVRYTNKYPTIKKAMRQVATVKKVWGHWTDTDIKAYFKTYSKDMEKPFEAIDIEKVPFVKGKKLFASGTLTSTEIVPTVAKSKITVKKLSAKDRAKILNKIEHLLDNLIWED